jgi:carboxymethylenebutenolidase
VTAYNPSLWEKAGPVVETFPSIAGAVVYNDLADKEKVASSPIPTLTHLAGEGEGSPIPQRHGKNITYTYTNKVSSHRFAIPFQQQFNYGTEAVSHTRNLQFLKPLMDGPYFDLEIIWEEHTYYEFADRSVEHTMSTMVQEPYVNHVPTVRSSRSWSSFPSSEISLTVT